MGAPRRGRVLIPLACLLAMASGCSFYLRSVPARRLPPQVWGEPRPRLVPVNPLLWQLRRAEAEILQPGDILAIYFERPEAQGPPPIHIPTGDAHFRTSAGNLYPIREDGTIKVPGVERAVKVSGLTVEQAESRLIDAVRGAQWYPEGRVYLSVMLHKRQEEEVLVVREDVNRTARPGSIREQAEAQVAGTALRATADFLRLEVGRNDLWHALERTGGRPGLDAEREILIFRGKFRDEAEARRMIMSFSAGQDPCGLRDIARDDSTVTRVPVYLVPGQEMPEIREEDITLHTGDIVVISSRPLDVYYTNGLLGGGQFPLPQDRDLDVLEAISIAGGNVGSLTSGFGLGFGGSAGTGGWFPPTWAIIVRKVPGYGQISIKVDVQRAMDDPRERTLIQPNDIIYLQYKPHEVLANILLRNISGNININDIFQ